MHLAAWQWAVGIAEFLVVFVPIWAGIGRWEKHKFYKALQQPEELLANSGTTLGHLLVGAKFHTPQIPVVQRRCANCEQDFIHHGPQNMDSRGWCPGCVCVEQKMRQSVARKVSQKAEKTIKARLDSSLSGAVITAVNESLGDMQKALVADLTQLANMMTVPPAQTGTDVIPPADLGELCDQYGALRLPAWAPHPFPVYSFSEEPPAQ